MDAGKRYEIPGPEINDYLFLTAIAVARVISICIRSPSHRLRQRNLGDSCTCSDLHSRRGTLSLGNSNLLIFFLCFFFLKGDTVSSRAVHCTKKLEKGNWKQRVVSASCKTCRSTRDPWRIVSHL
jgi:hypothetical protein